MSCWQQLPLLLCLWHRRIDLSFPLKCELVWRLYPNYSSWGRRPQSCCSHSTRPQVMGGFRAFASSGEAQDSSMTRPHPPALLRRWQGVSIINSHCAQALCLEKACGRAATCRCEQGGASSICVPVCSWCGRAQELCTSSWQSARSQTYHGVH